MPSFFFPSIETCRTRAQQYKLTIGHHVEPHEEDSGDMWGMLPISDTRIAIFIVDIAGHGEAATKYIPNIREALAEHLEKSNDPAHMLEHMNKNLHASLPTELFATLFYGIIDVHLNQLIYTTAACPTMIIMDAQGHVTGLSGAGFLLGAISDATYETHEVPFLPGSTLLLYSDALIESPDANGNMWKEEGLLNFLQQISGHPHDANSLMQEVMTAFEPYRGKHGRVDDDLTMVTFGRNPEN